MKFARELQLINAKLAAIAKLEASTQPAARSIEQMKQINERSTLEQQVEDIYEANRGRVPSFPFPSAPLSPRTPRSATQRAMDRRNRGGAALGQVV